MSRHNNQSPTVLTLLVDSSVTDAGLLDHCGRRCGFLVQVGGIGTRDGYGYTLTATRDGRQLKKARSAQPLFDAGFPTMEAARAAGAAHVAALIESLKTEAAQGCPSYRLA